MNILTSKIDVMEYMTIVLVAYSFGFVLGYFLTGDSNNKTNKNQDHENRNKI